MKRILFLMFSLLSAAVSFAQTDLYTVENSLKFGDYLYASKNFKSAAAEFERVIFMNPSDEMTRIKLLSSYRRAGQFDLGIKRYHDLYPNGKADNSLLNKEVALMYVYNNQFVDFDNFRIENQLPPKLDTTLLIGMLLLQERYELAGQVLTGNDSYPELTSIVLQANQLPLKSPILALSMSALVPGSGKIYAGQWKDGLFSLLFTGLSAWQAYRGFHKDGVSSFYGWLYSGVSLGFYAGNLYGSYKAVSRYNYQQKHEISHGVQDLLYQLD